MTDEQLLQLLEQKTPEELTLEELEYLKQRLADSAPLREALLGQLQMETYLSAALGRIQLSPQLIVAKAERQQGRGWGLGVALLLLFICLPIVGLTGVVLYRAVSVPGEGDTLVSQVSSDDEVDQTPSDGKEQTSPSSETVETASAQAADSNAANEDAAGPGTQPAMAGDGNQKADAGSPASASSTPPPKPKLPWEDILAQPGPQPAFETVAFDTFNFDKRLPRQADLQPWFEAATGSNFRLHEMDTKQGRCGAIEGVARLKAPLTDDSVLRIALEHYDKLQVHVYHGDRGVTLLYYEDQGSRWVAYATTRKDKAAKPDTLAATATDDDRCRRTEIRFGGPFELRYRKGEIILSRGDIVLLAAPLPGPPDDVFFEGRAAVQGIALARTGSDPSPLPPRPVTFETEKPSELEWTLHKNNARQPTDPQPVVEKRDDGSLRLAGDKLKQGAVISTPLPKRGLFEVVLELENVTPGASVFLGRQQGQVEHVLRFLKNRRDNRTIARVMWIGDEHEAEAEPFTHKPEACLADRCWVKLLYGCGNLRWWLSTDGVHWAQIDHATDGAKGNLESIGLHVIANRPETTIALKRVQLRELTGLTSLAEAGSIEAALPYPEASRIGEWTTEVLRKQPAGASGDAWRTACAIRTLGAGTHNELANDLLEALLEGGAFRSRPLEGQLAALNDAMLLAWDLRDNGAMKIGLPHRYIDVALQHYDATGEHAWSQVRRSAMSAPVNTWMQAQVPAEALLRWQVIAAVNDLSPDQVLELCRELTFFHQRQLSPLVTWADAVSQREATQRTRNQGIAVMKDGWRHPLVEELSKETYNLLNELQAVLDSEAWEDGARLITSLDPEAATGLAPYAKDRRLLVSLPTAVRLMLVDHPSLRNALGDQFAALARLRLNRAMASGNWSEVELAAVQFSGTTEAAAAHRWLGDQALASGWFERAMVEYSRARAIEPSLAGELAARERLAAAMLGRDFGEPVTQPVSFGEMRLEAAQFEALVGEMRGRGNTGVSHAASVVDATDTTVPSPAGYQAHHRSRLDGPTGEKPNEEVGRRTNQFRVPWVDRQLAVTTEGDLMYVANRFQVAAYRLNDGQRAWQSQPPPGNMQRSQEFALVAMRPLITGKRILVRMLYGEHPQMVCLEKADGKTVWTARLSDKEFFVSDPMVARGQIGALSIQLQDGQMGLLRWNLLDPDSGEVQSQRDLLRLRNTWGARACCEVAAWEDSFVAALGGLTVSFDPSGNLRWVRKNVVVPSDEDSRWILQRFERPLVVDDRVYVAQPGVRTVDCLDPATGSERWTVTIPDVLGIVGQTGELLIVQTERDFRALSLESGEVRWRHAVENVHPWQIVGDESLLYAKWEKTPGNDSQVRTRLVWLDPQTGSPLGSSIVESLVNDDPKLGPLVGYKDRIFAFFGKGQHEPTRDVFELTPSGKAEPPRSEEWLAGWQSTTPAIAAAAEKVVPRWLLLSAAGGDNTGLIPEAHGEKEVLSTRTQSGWLTTWAREIRLPAGTQRRLRLRVGTEPGMQWKLQVHMGDTQIEELAITDESHPDRWKNLEVPLAKAAGKDGYMTISASHTGGNPSPLYWKTVELVD